MTDERMPSNGSDLVDAIHEILRQSAEPMTATKIRTRLREPFGAVRTVELIDTLQRQVAANVLVICPKYRSGQDRYWDRSLREHAKIVLRGALRAGPLSWSELRKRFPKYVRHLADSVLNEEMAKETVFRHPPLSARMGPRYALKPADLRVYATKELCESLDRLAQLGFARGEAREALLRFLQEEEWADVPVQTEFVDSENSPILTP